MGHQILRVLGVLMVVFLEHINYLILVTSLQLFVDDEPMVNARDGQMLNLMMTLYFLIQLGLREMRIVFQIQVIQIMLMIEV